MGQKCPKWRSLLITLIVLGVGGTIPLSAEQPNFPEPIDPIEIHGQLFYGVASIGGETTGVMVITEGPMIYELYLPSSELDQLAESLNGELVNVSGWLTQVDGIEIPNRSVIHVLTLEPSKDKAVACTSDSSDYQVWLPRDRATAYVLEGQIFHAKLPCLVGTEEVVCQKATDAPPVAPREFRFMMRNEGMGLLSEVQFNGEHSIALLECEVQ